MVNIINNLQRASVVPPRFGQNLQKLGSERDRRGITDSAYSQEIRKLLHQISRESLFILLRDQTNWIEIRPLLLDEGFQWENW